MNRKAISLVLAMLIILASFPLTAFAADGDITVKSVELTATKVLIENYSGWKEKDENGDYFYYDVRDVQPNALITFSDGSTTTIEWEDFWLSFDSFDQSIEQGSGSKQLVVGQTYTADITLDCGEFDAYGIETTLTFEIEENPVSSVSVVATKPLVEGISGDWEKYYDENDEVVDTWFEYDIAKTDYVITVNYKDGTYISGNYFEILDETGYGLVCTYDQGNEPFVLGDNTIEVYYLGVEAEFTFTIIEDPVESIAFNATKTLVSEVNGYWDYIDYDDESKGKWFCYYVSDSEPQITVKYKNGDEVTCASYDCYDIFGEEFSWTVNQSSENPLTLGKHTIKAEFLGHECDFEFEIVQNPIKSISVNVADKLEENKDGFWEDIYDESGENIIGEYFFYDLDYETTTVTINYTDTTKASETYTLSEINEQEDFIFDIDLNQSSENPLAPGKYTTGKAKLNGVSCTFAFEILENPVKIISAKATKNLVENENGRMNGEDAGDPYFYYYVSDTEPEITVTYTDGTVETYSYQEICDDGSFDISVEQSSSSPLRAGTHTATVKFAGRKCEFTFTIVEDPIKSVVVTPTKDLVENTNGYMTEDSGITYFYYYLEDLMPTITINYKDGTQKVYDYITLKRYTDMEFYLDVYQEPGTFKLGENTATATLGGREIEYKFNIVKQNDSQKVKSLVVTPEQKLIENHGGWFNTDYNYETDTFSPEYYYYSSEYLTFTATVTFEDGTTKTYKNLDAFDEIEGSDFDVWFARSYENRFKVGKNTATANYRNATCEFQIEVVENDYTAVSISGENDLTITLTKADGTKENYKVEDIGVAGGGEGEIGGIVRTDSGKIFDVLFSYTLSEDTNTYNNVQAKLFYDSEEDAVLKSNVLASNKWMYLVFSNSEINQYAAIYADGYSERYFGREFKGFNGTISGETVDDILTISTGSSDNRRYENNGVDDKGPFAILTLEEARKLAGTYFDTSKIDFTTSPMYNAGPKEIKVYFINGYDGEIDNRKFVYENDKFSYSSDYISDYTGDSYPVFVALDTNGNVASISYVKGPCGNVKTVEAKNAKGGVNITFTAAENATEYEIYRSLNGAAFEKIGTTLDTSYLDKTAVSGKTYTYKVLPKNTNSQGGYSAGKTVTYLSMPKTTATLGKSGYTIKWTKVDGASTYRIYRAEYANGKWSNWNKLTDQKASVTSYADKNVKAGGVYKYTVRAMASGGVASAYEGTSTLIYLTTPTVKIANAKGGVKGSWNAVSGAEGYTVYRSEYNTATKKWSSWTNLGTTKATTKSFTDKTAVSGKTYRYTVRAVNGDNMSLYTASNTLLYLAEPTVTIANAKTGITVKWTKSGGAKGYTVYRSEYNASTKKWSSWKSMGTVGSSKTSWTDKSVKAGVTYKYTVRAVNEKVKSTFTASATLVRLAQPTVTISNAKTGVTVKWNKITGATGYKIYRQEFVNGKWSSWETESTVKSNKTSWTDTKAESGVTYRYTVRAVNGKSLSSYTATGNLMFLSEPNVKIKNASNGIKVSWNLVEGATGYTVYRSEYNAKTKKWSGWAIRGTAKAGKSSWTDKKVTSGVKYKYTVRAINGNFKSTYTSSGKLVYLAQPVVTSAKATSGIAVKWTKSGGATSYIVYRQEMTDGAWSKWASVATTKAKVNSYTDKTVEEGKEYRYTVRAVDGSYKSTYAASNSVKR